jgi:hypothetical protein
MSSAADFCNVLENFSVDILNNLNLANNKLKECPLNFTPMEFTELGKETLRGTS